MRGDGNSNQGAQSAVCHSLFQRGPHQGGRGVDEKHLAVGFATGGANALCPVRDAKCVDSLGSGLWEAAPEPRDPRVGLGREGIHRDVGQAGGVHGRLRQPPELVGDSGAKDRLHIRCRAEVVAGTGRAVDAFSDEGETGDVQRQDVHVGGGSGPVQAQRAALHHR